MTNQQQADILLRIYQENRALPEDRLEALMADLFLPIPPCDVEFDAIMRDVSEVMADA